MKPTVPIECRYVWRAHTVHTDKNSRRNPNSNTRKHSGHFFSNTVPAVHGNEENINRRGKTSSPQGTTVSDLRLPVPSKLLTEKNLKVNKFNASPFAPYAPEFPNKFDNMGIFLTALYCLGPSILTACINFSAQKSDVWTNHKKVNYFDNFNLVSEDMT